MTQKTVGLLYIFFFGIVILVVSVSWIAFSGLFYERETIFFTKEQFSVDRDRILEIIQQGHPNAFQAVPRNYIDEEILSTVDWTSEDYYSIAKALHEHVTGEGSQDWQVDRIDFSWSCEDLAHGPYSSSIFFFKINRLDNKNYQRQTQIVLEPLFNNFSVKYEEFYPLNTTGKGFQFDEITLSPEEAVALAEETGGKDFRNLLKNDCSVYVYSHQNRHGIEEWEVKYSASLGNPSEDKIFFINIDSGKIKEK